ncbi:hypothetical protein [Neobacillus mesonae]|uniref:hypothetical protein n=1 Tax=Neobacillus mesonae TaxID=1193713 RepID=UPI0025730E95|nr:hypothetical protein [Neobacillus mesonae]
MLRYFVLKMEMDVDLAQVCGGISAGGKNDGVIMPVKDPQGVATVKRTGFYCPKARLRYPRR